MSLMITGGGTPASLSAHESERHNPPAGGSSTQNNHHKAISAVNPSISISPFGQVDIAPSSDGGVTLSHNFFNLHVGQTWSKDILASSGEAHAGADVSGSGYVSVTPKDNVCVGLNLSESLGVGASATATAGRASGTVGKDAAKDIRDAHIQVCTGPGAGRDIVATADGIATGVRNGLRAVAEAVPAIVGFDNRFRTDLGEMVDSPAPAGAATTGAPAIERILTPLLDLF